jgi:nucleotide-binding universal stress UspA family protein
MAWKSVITFVTDAGRDSATLEAAISMTRANDGHLDVFCLGVDPTQPEIYYTGAYAVTLPGALVEAEKQAKDLEAAVRARLEREEIRWSVTGVTTPIVGITQVAADFARFADVVVLPKPYGPGRTHVEEAVLEAALFAGSAPVLVVTDAVWKAPRKISVAWNDSPEALRAVRAAMPLITAAGGADIVVIDPPRHGPERSDPGGRISQMLARHGVRADVEVLARSLPRISDVLIRHMTDANGDLMVMGAYGHSRLRESILGGATRNILEAATFPVLLAH